MGSADRGFTWSDEETSTLLKLWGDHDPHNNNNASGNKRNFVIYEKISQQMKGLGYNRSSSQCREKIKRMKREYTLTKQFNGTTNGPKKSMRFYEQFEKILFEKQSRNQRNTTIKNSSLVEVEAPTQTSPERRRSKRSITNNQVSPLVILNDFPPAAFDEDTWTPADALLKDEASPSFFQSNSSSQQAGPSRKKRKKIASRMSMFKEMMDSVTTKFCEYQQLSDNRFLTEMEVLEQERKTADENIQKMWLEFEEKVQKEEKEHELNMLSAFTEVLGKVANHTTKESL